MCTIVCSVLKQFIHICPDSQKLLSGAKVFLRDRNFNVEVFSHPTLKKLAKGFQRLSDLIPKQAPALSAKSIKQIVDVLRQLSVEGQVAAAALLFGTCSFLRQSNFLMNQGMLVNPHIVCRADLVIKRNVM